MSRSLNAKQRSIEKKIKGEKRKERKKTRGEHGCARLHALPRSDISKPTEATGKVKIPATTQSKGSMLSKIKFKLLGR